MASHSRPPQPNPPSTRNDEAESDLDDEIDDTPFHRKRVFGAGLHKKAITFVPASSESSIKASGIASAPAPAQSVADLYLSMVLPREPSGAAAQDVVPVCEICNLPLRAEPGAAPESSTAIQTSSEDNNGATRARLAHEASFAHQVCVPHVHPPSAVDRSRMGLAVLASQGWDPDARRGLGAAQQGMQFPIKPRPKADKAGLGVPVTARKAPPEKKLARLDAGKVRKQYVQEQRRTEQLRRQLFGDDKLERYLGSAGLDP